MAKSFIVAIDGPSGAGKSTVSRKLAKRLGGVLLDTGAMYRSVAWAASQKEKVSPEQLGSIAAGLKFEIAGDGFTLLIDGKDLGNALRGEKVSQMASVVSAEKSVREALTEKQRNLGDKWSAKCPVVVEGRDIGTVVFPKAAFKFFVTATAEVRAKRRWDQLKEKGLEAPPLLELLKEIETRDQRDSTRKTAPLKQAEAAIFMDSTSLSIDEVVESMKKIIERSPKGPR